MAKTKEQLLNILDQFQLTEKVVHKCGYVAEQYPDCYFAYP